MERVREQLMRHVFVPMLADGCWPWMAYTDAKGYGIIRIGGRAGKTMKAHRVSWQLFRGAIPSELQIDHLCRNRRCVNPAHLEVVTSQINSLRGDTVSARHAAKIACPQGHLYDAENTYRYSDGKRACRECRRGHRRAYKEKMAV